jgi:predicted TIM-barrel fold metal-dependent hydrolase
MTEELRTLAKIDPHHHLWDLEHNDYPWLREPGAPRMYGDFSAMCRSYLIDDFRADSAPHNVVKSVHVQANWNPADPVGETRWCQAGGPWGIGQPAGHPAHPRAYRRSAPRAHGSA